jgi:nitrogen fixation protein FixH
MSARGFTGRHMWLTMVGFFGTVIIVNFVMAWYASSTFGGTVVDNSYVASQQFNGWLKAARSQAKLGWTTQLGIDGGRHPTLAVTSAGAPGIGFKASGTAHHPLGGAPDVALVFAPTADGQLVSAQPLPPGRWLVRIAVARDGHVLRLAQSLQ